MRTHTQHTHIIIHSSRPPSFFSLTSSPGFLTPAWAHSKVTHLNYPVYTHAHTRAHTGEEWIRG